MSDGEVIVVNRIVSLLQLERRHVLETRVILLDVRSQGKSQRQILLLIKAILHGCLLSFLSGNNTR